VLGFENLTEIILGKNDGEFLLGCAQGRVPNVEKVRAEGQMRAMLFQDAEGQQAGAFGLLDGIAEVRGSQLFPLYREFRLCMHRASSDEKKEQRKR